MADTRAHSCCPQLLLGFDEAPDVWTLSFDEGDASGSDDGGAFVSEEESPSCVFIRAHQEALILHGGRDELYEVSRIPYCHASPEVWRWEKLAGLEPAEVRERIMGDLRRSQGFDGLDRQVGKWTERGGLSDRMVRNPERESLAGAMRALGERYLARLATVEAPFHRAQHQDEPPAASSGS
jgi:hypothetical protein